MSSILKHFSALVLASPEIRFQVDSETMDPIDVQAKKLFETNSMVEEFMLLANISVAEKILAEFPDCAMLRRHPEPPMSNFDPLVKAARHLVRYTGMCSQSLYNIMYCHVVGFQHYVQQRQGTGNIAGRGSASGQPVLEHHVPCPGHTVHATGRLLL